MELFKIFGTLSLNGKDKFNKDIDDASKKGESLSTKIGNGLKTVAKVGAVAITAAATATAAIAKSSLNSYAEYEQLVGGVDTLFKDSSKKVQRYAADAYKTAGMSANDYMETVTSFSASLLQSLGGNTAEAADIADMAIRDMSDNANKMGTDMSAIQNAYQGFAKQNYTMLDNLKLGYGGTKSEMERLLKDATALTGIEYDIDSLNDVYEAIHAIQEEIGITGTTAKEAATTIQGSIYSAKAAWQNLLTGFADDNADVQALTDTFVETVTTAAGNIVPRVIQILQGLTVGLASIVESISAELPSMISAVLPSVISGAMALMQGLVAAIPTLMTVLIDCLPQIVEGVTQIFNGIIEALPTLMESIATALPTLIPIIIDGIVSMITTITSNFMDICSPIIDMIPEIITAVTEALIANAPALIDAVAELILTLIISLPEIMMALEDAFVQHFKTIWEGIKGAFEDPAGWFSSTFGEAKDAVAEKWPSLVDTFSDVWERIKTRYQDVGDWFANIFEDAKNSVSNAWANVTSFIQNPIEEAKTFISNIISDIEGFFADAKLELPNIKLPHFSITGDFSLNPISVPKLSVDWYAKGGVLQEPTIFGLNGNSLMGGGEAGAEAVAPISVLQGYVSQAVAEQNSGLVDTLNKILIAIINLDQNIGGNMREALDGTAISINNREFGRLVRGVV